MGSVIKCKEMFLNIKYILMLKTFILWIGVDHDVSSRIIRNFNRSANMQAASLEPPKYFDEEKTVSSFPFNWTWNGMSYDRWFKCTISIITTYMDIKNISKLYIKIIIFICHSEWFTYFKFLQDFQNSNCDIFML